MCFEESFARGSLAWLACTAGCMRKSRGKVFGAQHLVAFLLQLGAYVLLVGLLQKCASA